MATCGSHSAGMRKPSADGVTRLAGVADVLERDDLADTGGVITQFSRLDRVHRSSRAERPQTDWILERVYPRKPGGIAG